VNTRLQLVFACVLLGAVAGTCKTASADSLQTISGCNCGAPTGTVSFTSPDNGLPSTINWSGTGHVNGPTDIGASMSASYANFAPGSLGDAYNYFAEWANFTDTVTLTGTGGYSIIFNFTVTGTSFGSNNDYADYQVFVCISNACNVGGIFPLNGEFSVPFLINPGPGQYPLLIRLEARDCLWGCTSSTAPATGTNLSGTADYNDTLTLESVTLGADQTMIGQSGLNYGDLSPTSVPEPSSMVLLFTGFAGLVAARKHRPRRLEG
jgi:hypothetical protein